MKPSQFFKAAIVSLATLGVVMPQAGVLAAAESRAPARSTVRIARTGEVADVTLAKDGTFAGRVVDHGGMPLADAEVVVRQGQREVARTRTDAKGAFAVKNARDGVYEVAAGKTKGRFHLWTSETAPKVSREQALLVMGENGARGQYGAVDPALLLLTAAVIASVILAAIAVDKIDNLQDDVDGLQDQVNKIQQSL